MDPANKLQRIHESLEALSDETAALEIQNPERRPEDQGGGYTKIRAQYAPDNGLPRTEIVWSVLESGAGLKLTSWVRDSSGNPHKYPYSIPYDLSDGYQIGEPGDPGYVSEKPDASLDQLDGPDEVAERLVRILKDGLRERPVG